jgi:hypothetical protein
MFDMQRALLSFQLFSFWAWNIKKITLNTDSDNNKYDNNDKDKNYDDGSSSSHNMTVATTWQQPQHDSSNNMTVATTSKLNKKAMLTLSSDCFFHLYTYFDLKTHSNQHNKMQNTKPYIKLQFVSIMFSDTAV